MAVSEEPSQEKDQKEAKPPPRVDDGIKEPDQENQKDKHMTTTHHLKTSQSEKRSVSPLSLFKEDFYQFKEDVLNVFRDKDSRTEPENTSSQAEDKLVSSTLGLLKEDLNQFKDDVTSVFSSNRDTKSADPKTSQSTERTNNRLSFFGMSLTRERDTAKEDPSKIKASKAERKDESFLSLFRREQKTLNKVESSQGGKETLSELRDKQVDDKMTETNNTEKIKINEKTDEAEDSEVDVSEEKSESLSETQQTEEVLKVFKNKDSKTGPESTTSQAEDKPISSTPGLLMEDLNQFIEDVTNVFSSNRVTKSADPKTSQSTERTNNSLSSFKDDLSNFYGISLTRERDTAKEDPSKIKAEKAERKDESSLIREQKTLNKVESSQEGKETLSELSEEQVDDKMTETKDTEKINKKTDEAEDREEDVPEEKSENLSETQQTEGVLKVFRDKDSKTGPESTSSKAEGKLISSTPGLLKEDLNQLKEDVTSVCSSNMDTKSADPKTSQSTERTNNRLSFFGISLTRERDTAKEEPSKIKAEKAERKDESFLSLFRREQKTLNKIESSQGGKETLSEVRDEQVDDKQTETNDTEKIKINEKTDEAENSEVDVQEEKSESLSETQQTEENLKVFRDKDSKTGPESTTSQAEDKLVSSTPGLLKEDLNQLEGDITSVFGSNRDTKSADPKTSQSTERTNNRLSFFGISLTRERDTAKEDPSKIKAEKAERKDESSLIREQKTLDKVESSQEGKETLSELREEQVDDKMTETKDTEKINKKTDGAEDREEEVPEEKSESLPETQQTEEVLKVFKNKDSKSETKSTTSQAEDKLVSSTPGLLKEDLNQFKEDVTSVFSSNRAADSKTGQSAERTNNRLSFFRDDFSNVFRMSLKRERDTPKEDLSKIKATKAERKDESFLSLFRREQKTLNKVESSQAGKETLSELRDGQIDDKPTETKDTEKINITEKTDEAEGNEVEDPVSEEKSESFSETQQPGEMITSAQTVHFLNPLAEQSCESEAKSDNTSVVSEEYERVNGEEAEAEDKEEDHKNEEVKDEDLPSDTLLSLSSMIGLLSLRDPNKDDMREHGGDLWSVKNFACYLTFDPNTANSELHLTDGNRKATRVWSEHRPSDHPERFERCPQVLCREGLLDSVYWEVLWSGGADIGVSYNNISRNGDPASCLLGHNQSSWSLECSEGSYTPCHNKKRFKSSSPQPFTRRVGVYLNWSAGALSFYCISKDTMVHLHTFTSTFSEPLYPGFWVWAYDGSVSLCQVELGWERLLQ